MPSGKVKKGKAPVVINPHLPCAPSYLDNVARDQFKALARVLLECGKLPQTDVKLIEAYAANYSLLIRAVEDLNTQPLTYTSENGRPFVNPLIAVVHNATQKVRQIIADLALSPVTAKLVEGALPPVDPSGKWQGVL